MKDSVELCINKCSYAAAKSELKANCEKFDSELGELRTPDGLAGSCVSSMDVVLTRCPAHELLFSSYVVLSQKF